MYRRENERIKTEKEELKDEIMSNKRRKSEKKIEEGKTEKKNEREEIKEDEGYMKMRGGRWKEGGRTEDERKNEKKEKKQEVFKQVPYKCLGNQECHNKRFTVPYIQKVPQNVYSKS